jgi:tRNA(adenine34) deaminase
MRRDADGVLPRPPLIRDRSNAKAAYPHLNTRMEVHSNMATRKAAKKSSKKTYATKSGKRSTTPPSKRWSAKVKTDSTKPAPGIFKKSAKEIAANLEKKSVSPKGPGQGMRMLNFYENRGGKNLSAERRHALEGAKKILHEDIEQRGSKRRRVKSTTKKATKKSTRRT